MTLVALHALSPTLPMTLIIAKWMSLIGVAIYMLLAASFLVERPPRIQRAATKALFGAMSAALYLAITRENRTPYLFAILLFVVTQIALDVWEWHVSRIRGAT